jgi:hypothetical protein
MTSIRFIDQPVILQFDQGLWHASILHPSFKEINSVQTAIPRAPQDRIEATADSVDQAIKNVFMMVTDDPKDHCLINLTHNVITILCDQIERNEFVHNTHKNEIILLRVIVKDVMIYKEDWITSPSFPFYWFVNKYLRQMAEATTHAQFCCPEEDDTIYREVTRLRTLLNNRPTHHHDPRLSRYNPDREYNELVDYIY